MDDQDQRGVANSAAFTAIQAIAGRLRAEGWTSEQIANWLTCVLEHLGPAGFRTWLVSDPELPYVRSDDPGGWYMERAERSRRFHDRRVQPMESVMLKLHAPAGTSRSVRPRARAREHRAASRRRGSRGSPSRQDAPDPEPGVTPLQAETLATVAAMEAARVELDWRGFETYLGIVGARIARYYSAYIEDAA
jgi:hypothetical protein